MILSTELSSFFLTWSWCSRCSHPDHLCTCEGGCYRHCVFSAEHLASKQLSEQTDELGVCGHAFNELRTRPELKERGRKRWRYRRKERRKITLWIVISVPGRGQSTPPAVTFPFSTICSLKEMSFSECMSASHPFMSETFWMSCLKLRKFKMHPFFRKKRFLLSAGN